MTAQSVAFVLGTHPEMIEPSPVVREGEERDVPSRLLYAGRDYSDSLDWVTFKHLELPAPDYSLKVGSKSHGRQTGEMVAGTDPRDIDGTGRSMSTVPRSWLNPFGDATTAKQTLNALDAGERR